MFRQLFDPQSPIYTYLLGGPHNGQAALIDPVLEQVARDAAPIDELALGLLEIPETHVHADHGTGTRLLERRTGSRIMLAAANGAEGADRYPSEDVVVAVGGHRLPVQAAPGHAKRCVTYALDDHSMACTSDRRLIHGSSRTDFQNGDPCARYQGGNATSCLPTWARLSIIAAAFLLSPVFGVLMAIAGEVVIRSLMEAGAPALLAPLIAGGLGWPLLRKLQSRVPHLAASSQRSENRSGLSHWRRACLDGRHRILRAIMPNRTRGVLGPALH